MPHQPNMPLAHMVSIPTGSMHKNRITCDPDVAVCWAASSGSHIITVAIQPLALLATHKIPITDLLRTHLSRTTKLAIIPWQRGMFPHTFWKNWIQVSTDSQWNRLRMSRCASCPMRNEQHVLLGCGLSAVSTGSSCCHQRPAKTQLCFLSLTASPLSDASLRQYQTATSFLPQSVLPFSLRHK